MITNCFTSFSLSCGYFETGTIAIAIAPVKMKQCSFSISFHISLQTSYQNLSQSLIDISFNIFKETLQSTILKEVLCKTMTSKKFSAKHCPQKSSLQSTILKEAHCKSLSSKKLSAKHYFSHYFSSSLRAARTFSGLAGIRVIRAPVAL